MAQVSVATAKRLFAISGNCCAFPKCASPLVDESSGKVTGRICHIAARNEGGPRYDPTQTDEQRNEFENLLLLCPIHHDVVDADDIAYSVQRLKQMKAEHERQQSPRQEPSNAVAETLIGNVGPLTIVNGSFIFTQNQLGGQVAHQITNIGSQPRTVSAQSGEVLVAALRAHPPESVEMRCLMNDAETCRFSKEIGNFLVKANWKIVEELHVYPKNPINNITLGVPKAKEESKAALILWNWFHQNGHNTTAELLPDGDNFIILVGTRS